MVTRVGTVAFQGIDVLNVDVQVVMASGLPAFHIVGLPDKAVGESRDRVRAALSSLGLSMPPRRITVNLAPADVAKEGSHFDLPIAIGLLGAMGVLSEDETRRMTAMGRTRTRRDHRTGVGRLACRHLCRERGPDICLRKSTRRRSGVGR